MAVEIAVATGEDQSEFLSLWAEYLIVHEMLGSDIHATDRTLAFFASLFEQYTTGSLIGVPLMARAGGEPVAVLLWGALPPAPVDRVEESVVNGFGSFVVQGYRRQGISSALRNRVILELDALGVVQADGVALLRNTPGVESSRSFQFKPTTISGSLQIAAEAAAIRAGEKPEGFYWKGLCPLCGKE